MKIDWQRQEMVCFGKTLYWDTHKISNRYTIADIYIFPYVYYSKSRNFSPGSITVGWLKYWISFWIA
jgi:hypothetical protein